MPDGRLKSICSAPDGSVWAGTESGLARVRGRRAEIVGEKPDGGYGHGFGRMFVWADRTGTVRVSYDRLGGRRFDGATLVDDPEFPPPPDESLWTPRSSRSNAPILPGPPVCACEDRAGRLWIGCRQGVLVRQDGHWAKRFDRADIGIAIRTIAEDPTGAMWFRTQGGELKRLAGGRITVYSITNGLADNRATALHADLDGAMWIGTANGLSRFRDGRFAAIRAAEGLAENSVTQVLEDDFGNLWLNGPGGIHRVSRSQLNAVADGRANRVQCFSYGVSDGVPNTAMTDDFAPAGCKSPNGHLWFPTFKGLLEVDPRGLIESEVAPGIVIEQVNAGEKTVWSNAVAPQERQRMSQGKSGIEQPNTTKFAPDAARVIEIRYTANCLSAPEKARFKWKLEPRDGDWNDVGGQRFVFLQNLRPGAYTFRLIGCNCHGFWNEAGASFAFSIAPHFWQTWSFYAACGLVVFGAVAGVEVYRLRWHRRLLAARRSEALADERARIARDLHDDLGTALTGVALELDMARRQSGDGAGQRLSDTATLRPGG